MNKLLTSVGLVIGIATASMLAGCNLYFGDHHNSGDDNASGGGGSSSSSGSQPGFGCTSDANCAAGCFCADGTCTEGGFCGSDADCGDGFHCDTARSSCEPNTPPTAGGCKVDTDCKTGSICDTSNGSCTATCTCTSDADAVKQGAGFCDETRMTCEPGTDPAGVCNGTLAKTCTQAAPLCAEGQVALTANGCYTGQCEAITACGATPTCSELQHADDCQNRATDCTTVSEGHGCTRPDGSACSTGDTNCTCTSFTFQSCEDKGPAPAQASRIIYAD
jgi:hypothetical protein